MVNGLGVLGWGVGGIEAEAASAGGEPVSMLHPAGASASSCPAQLPEGATATDLVLTITEMLRQAQAWSASSCEFYGPGVSAAEPPEDRATIANMAPEYGAHGGASFRWTPRPLSYLQLHWPDCGAPRPGGGLLARSRGSFTRWRRPSRPSRRSWSWTSARWSPSLAGPKRPQDRVILAHAKQGFREALRDYVEREDIDCPLIVLDVIPQRFAEALLGVGQDDPVLGVRAGDAGHHGAEVKLEVLGVLGFPVIVVPEPLFPRVRLHQGDVLRRASGRVQAAAGLAVDREDRAWSAPYSGLMLPMVARLASGTGGHARPVELDELADHAVLAQHAR